MSAVRTQPTESANKRNIPTVHMRGGEEARAVNMPFRPLLELQPLYFGGEITAG